MKYGFLPLEDPGTRKSLAKTITLRKAKELIGMSDGKFEEMMGELRAFKRIKA